MLDISNKLLSALYFTLIFMEKMYYSLFFAFQHIENEIFQVLIKYLDEQKLSAWGFPLLELKVTGADLHKRSSD